MKVENYNIDVYDDVLEHHVAEYISMEMKELSWKYDYRSNTFLPNKHWHIFCGHNPKGIVDNGYEWVLPIWNTIKSKYHFDDKYDVDFDDEDDIGYNLDYLGWGATQQSQKFEDLPDKLLKIQV